MPQSLMSRNATEDFLARNGLAAEPRVALAGDASARRYVRIGLRGSTVLLMDQSAAPAELLPFERIGALLAGLGLSVPQIIAVDRAAGLALIEDFGDDVFGALLPTRETAGQQALYDLAVDALVAIHRRFQPPSGVERRWDAAVFAEQAGLYLEQWQPDSAAGSAFLAAWRGLLARFDAEPQTLLLRDYHVDNLMLLPRDGVAAAGVIDFQDAGLGPALYDLVSLVEDVRRPVAPERRAMLLDRYRTAMGLADDAGFRAAVSILAAQRHTRILGVFRRLVDQGKTRYAPLIEPTRQRLSALLNEDALTPIRDFYRLA